MTRKTLCTLLGTAFSALVLAFDAHAQAPAAPAPSAGTVSSQAVVPRLMKFNGALRDGAGKPVTGPVDVTFALYSTDSGGDPLWIETQSVQADDQGRYTALIGVMHTDGLPMELFASGEARWLGAQVANEPEQKPRVLLLSVPYALKAADAETLGGLPASAFVVAPGFSPAGASAPASGTAVSAAQTGASGAPTHRNSSGHKAAACSSITSDGTATANSITMFTTSCNIESSAISQLSGNIGIGTTSPAVAFQVNGPLGNPQVYPTPSGIARIFGAAANTALDVGALPAPPWTAWIQVGTNVGSGVYPLSLNPLGGGVGIGTTSPTGTLSVVSNGAPLPPQSATLALAAPAGIVPFRMKQNTPGSTTPALIDLETSDGKLAQLSAGGTGIFQINATAGNAMAFATNGFTPRMYIDTTGNVGIGTLTPSANLEVSGATKFDSPVTFAGGQTFPGTGTITSIFAGAGLAGGGTSGSVGLAIQTCPNGLFLQSTGTGWVCSSTVTSVTAGAGLAGGGVGSVGLAVQTCPSGQFLQSTGAGWVCASVGGGEGSITGVTAGTDLTGGGSSGVVVLNLDTTQVPTLAATTNTFAGVIQAKDYQDPSGNSIIGLHGVREFLSSGYFIAPPNVTHVQVEAWGAGGGGGGADDQDQQGLCAYGGAGGTGGYTRDLIAVVPGATYYIGVATGGPGGSPEGSGGGASGTGVVDHNMNTLSYAGGGSGGAGQVGPGFGQNGANGAPDPYAAISHSKSTQGYVEPPDHVAVGGGSGTDCGGAPQGGFPGQPGYIILMW